MRVRFEEDEMFVMAMFKKENRLATMQEIRRILPFIKEEGRMTELMVKQEEIKTLPFGDVWAEYCEECGAPKDGTWFGEIEKYEETVLTKRV